MPFTEVADRVWVRRVPSYDVNLVAVGGERGLVVVDTLATAAEARASIAAIGDLGAGRVVAVVNTHDHFDHVLGNATFKERYDDPPVHATEEAAARTDPAAPPADHTFSSAAVIDLGDRQVELVHPGRGHTAGDLVVRVPDADVLLAGDLVEESAPPSLGADSWPLDWPQTLDLVLGLTTPSTVVVPGHGGIVDRRFVEDQCDDLRAVAETIRELATRGVPEADALAAAEWPFPVEALHHAIGRGYAHLPPQVRRRLPLA
ncbi:MBL fold metallo-hydrolase [Nocardioides nitrophenolicus]|uniref:MBL fold metallo-hydrolase n=1 Tax=Nocardioides nitrophenolicus TaxID=60489 RepID=UPI00195A7745|nr:MBL fold metallo-hydrolase [Nocardioides nitrophenolicus]MBM7519753.1 glyoxylase-like metal-dependent hydrolase (beta-lactamase superfamily II) [Nocardioides nitrophenolicus]